MRASVRTSRNTRVSLGPGGMMVYALGWCIMGMFKLTILLVVLLFKGVEAGLGQLQRYYARRQS